jgi:Holliday junction resolvase RusA-like endonuclease
MKLTVYGKPATKGSSRAFPRHAGGITVVPDNRPALVDWQGSVRDAAQKVAQDRGGALLAGPLRGQGTWWLPRPKGHYGSRGLLDSAPTYPEAKPDLDKLARAVFDALIGVWYTDDAQLVDLTIRKRYAAQDTAPRLELEVDPL